VTKLAIAIIILTPLAAIGIALVALYYANKVDQEMFNMELDFDTVDF
jgi:hypothetical protein